MKTIRWNGEEWYEDRRSLMQRVRQWVVRPLGWERRDKARGVYVWQFTKDYGRSRWRDPFPICLFGHRLSLFSSWVDVRAFGRHFHWGFRRNPNVMYGPLGIGYAYISHNGTPQGAHHWLWGWEKWHGYRDIAKQIRAKS